MRHAFSRIKRYSSVGVQGRRVSPCTSTLFLVSENRGDRIRTCDLTYPQPGAKQTEPHPDNEFIITDISEKVKFPIENHL